MATPSTTRHATTLTRQERQLSDSERCAPVAFVCHGECGGVCDRPWNCGTTTCSRHGENLVQEPVVFMCPQCHATSADAALCDCNFSPQMHREAHVQCASCKENGPLQCCAQCPVVLDVSQLPSLVPAVLCGSKIALPFSRDDFVAVVPAATRELEWFSRFVRYKNVSLELEDIRPTKKITPDLPTAIGTNLSLISRAISSLVRPLLGSRASGSNRTSRASWATGAELPTNQCVCLPGQSLRLKFGWQSRFDYHPDAYCPGCIVQVYVGIGNVYSHGCIEYGVGSASGHCDSICEAPQEPGVYYVTQAISLQYSYVNVSHPMGPELAIAALRVLSGKEWTPVVHRLLSESSRIVIDAVQELGTADDSTSLFKRLPIVLLHIVYAFAMDY